MSEPVYSYQSISGESSGEFKDRGSKFISFCFPIKDEQEIKTFLAEIKERHPKARHHCYAWRRGITKDKFRANDDGEPSGSAGLPILGQIDSRELTNVLVIVVRYFGGTLLGIPGLINAYKTAASEGLNAATRITKELTCLVSLAFDYTQLGAVMNLIKRYDGEVCQQKMELFCELKAAISLRKKASFLEELASLYEVKVEVE